MIFKLLRKDFALLFRSRGLFTSLAFFGLLLVVVAGFSFRQPGLGPSELRLMFPGVCWMVFLFVSAVTLQHSLQPEEENRAVLGLLMSGAPSEAVYISKVITNWIFLSLLQLLIIPFSILFLGVAPGSRLVDLAAFSLLAGLGISSLGTLLSALSISVRGRDLLLPILLYPLLLPLLLASVSASTELIHGASFWQLDFPLVLVCTFNVVSITLGLLLFERLFVE